MSTPFSAPERQGSLDRVFLPGLLFRLHRLSYQGTVQVGRGSLSKSIYYRNGAILSAASNEEGDRLSSLLLTAGAINPDQLQMARDKAGPGVSLGRSLVDLGFVSRHQLMETARSQVRGILGSLIRWPDGEYRLEENQVPPAVPNLGMRTERLLFDLMLGFDRREPILAEIGGMDRHFRAVTDNPEDWHTWGLGEPADQVFGAVNGIRSVSHVAAEAGVDDFVAAKVLCAGLHLGILDRPDPDPTAAETPVVAAADEAGPDRPEPASAPEPAAEPAFEPTAYDSTAPKPIESEKEIDRPTETDRPDPLPAAGPVPPPQPPPAEIPPINRTEMPARPDPVATMELPSTGSGSRPDAFPAVRENRRSSMEQTPIDPEPANTTESQEAVPDQAEGPFEGFIDTAPRASLRDRGGSGGGSGRPFTRWLAIGGFLIGAAALVYAGSLWLSRSPGGPEPAVAAAPPVDRSIDPPADASAAESTRPDSGRVAAVPSTESADPVEPAEPTAAPTPAATPVMTPPVDPPAAAEPPPTRPAAAPASGSNTDAGAAMAAGNFSAAAVSFQNELTGAAGEYTLQVLLACRESTVAGLMPAPAGTILLPQKHGDRNCYRLCWGRFPNRNAAVAARSQLPDRFAALNGKAFPLPLGPTLAGTESGATP